MEMKSSFLKMKTYVHITCPEEVGFKSVNPYKRESVGPLIDFCQSFYAETVVLLSANLRI